MLEIIFNSKRLEKCDIKIIGLALKQKFRDSDFDKFLTDEEMKAVKKALKSETDFGKNGDYVEMYVGSGKIMCFGLGCRPDSIALQKIGGMIVQKLHKERTAAFLVSDIKDCRLSKEETAHSIAYGMLLGNYRFDKYFTKKKEEDYPALEMVYFVSNDTPIALKNFVDYASLSNAVRYARDLVNEPANKLNPEIFADDIKRLEYLRLEVDILDKKALAQKGFNMVLDVAKGAVSEPRVAVIKWQGDKSRKDFDIGLVGKGVTYDAGGINIKTGKNLDNMHMDMGGAAAVVAAMKSIALQRRTVNAVAIVGLVENMPDGGAMRPNDVLTSMSGQTVEVIDTDGEGRLVLADLLWYLQNNFDVSKIVDVATLTGTVAYALAGEYAGVYGNDKKLIADLLKSGEETGELLWELPIKGDYDKWIDSDVADMKNIGKKLGDGSQAACFLQRFIKEGTRWAHIDIAGCEISEENKPLCPKGATGFGVQLLNRLIMNISTRKN